MECGAKIEETDLFYPSCGTQINYPEGARVNDTTGTAYPHSFATILGYIFAIIGGWIGIIFGIYLWTREHPRAKFHGKVVLILTVCMIIFWIILTIFISYLSYLGTFGGI